MDCSLPGSSVHGIFQARVLEWGAIAFSNKPHSNHKKKKKKNLQKIYKRESERNQYTITENYQFEKDSNNRGGKEYDNYKTPRKPQDVVIINSLPINSYTTYKLIEFSKQKALNG